MGKVLIVTNLYHSSPRIIGLIKYLPEFGWESTILTIPVDKVSRNTLGDPSKIFRKVKIIETLYRGDIFRLWRKLFKFLGFNTNESILNQTKEKIGINSKKSFIDYIFNLYQTIFGYPDDEKGWGKPAVKLGRELLKKEKFDAIISSSSPVTAHIIAYYFKKEFHLPWVADFRDLWTQNYNYPYPKLRKIFERRLELKTLSIANTLITVAKPMTEELKELYRGKEIYTISNGFDPEKVNMAPVDLTPKFTITYTGQIYIGKQDPSKILIALNNLISKKIINSGDIEVRFYGPKNFWLKKEIEKYGLSSIVKQYGIVPREIALKKQWESQLLLLLNWEDVKVKGAYTGKIFEYLAAQRPIIATGGSGSDVVEELLSETKSGVYGSTIEEIEEYLKNFYLEYKQKSKVSFNGDRERINKYSYREIAKKFADILNKIV